MLNARNLAPDSRFRSLAGNSSFADQAPSAAWFCASPRTRTQVAYAAPVFLPVFATLDYGFRYAR
jgi:hypothetical protein